MNPFVVSALPVPVAGPALARAERRTAEGPGYPCRRCLRDAEAGEDLLLVEYFPFTGATTWTGAGPIWLHTACPPAAATTAVPEQLRRRTLSVRAFDAALVMVDAALTEGSDLEGAVGVLLDRDDVAFLHVHFAGPGCFAARIDRAA